MKTVPSATARDPLFWAELSPKQLAALLRVYAPDKTPLTPKDLILARQSIDHAEKACRDSLRACKGALDALQEARTAIRGLWTLGGFQEAPERSTEAGEGLEAGKGTEDAPGAPGEDRGWRML